MSSAQSARHVVADNPECHDVRTHAWGSVFAAPRQMRTWTLEGYSSDEVLGASNGKNGFGILGLLHDQVTGWVTQPERLVWS